MAQPVHRDPADFPESSHYPDIAAAIDTPQEMCFQAASDFWAGQAVPLSRGQLVLKTAQFALQHAGGQTLRKEDKDSIQRILALILDSAEDALLTARCIDFVADLNVQGSITEQEIADLHHLTRAAVCKRCINIIEELGLPPGKGMRSLKTRGRYRLRQRGRRTVLRRPRWHLGGLLRSALHDTTSARS